MSEFDDMLDEQDFAAQPKHCRTHPNDENVQQETSDPLQERNELFGAMSRILSVASSSTQPCVDIHAIRLEAAEAIAAARGKDG